MNIFRSLENPEATAALRTSRRRFLAIGGAAAVLTACDSDSNTDDDDADVILDFSNDFGVLNYAYALEQLEAAYYAQVVQNPYTGITNDELAILTDLREHEGIHRDFLRAAIMGAGGQPIPNLTPDFSAVNFSNRASVLGTARVFEDLGVSAYNGAGRYIESDTYLVIAGKIVSVEARHASVIRDLLNPGTNSFADLSTLTALGASVANGLDGAATPSFVLSAAAPFIQQSIGLRNVPTS